MITHLRASGTSLLVELSDGSMPHVLHWGRDLGDLAEADLEAVSAAAGAGVGSNALDERVRLTMLPEHGLGWPGLPRLSGSRRGQAWSPRFTVVSAATEPAESGGSLRVDSHDPALLLHVSIEVEMTTGGLLRLRATVTNQHQEQDYDLEGLVLALPVPLDATELLDFTGRHNRERSPQRQPFTVGTRLRDSRRGRTGHDATLILAVGQDGFGFRSGGVWGVHVAWSGNHRTYAERLSNGMGVIGGGELLLPGEVRLAPQGSYQGPWIYASYGDGLDQMSERFHHAVRQRPGHAANARPVILNTWEAMYFSQDLEKLKRLADAGAKVGVERFVLDDGWFRNRRNDRAGLGDWYVDEQVWPDGLHPLVDHVRSLGMQFGLWVEPEMVNPDSDLAREHPDWILSTGDRLPVPGRFQQVLNLARPQAWKYILERLDDLVETYSIDYLKWDHNRDLVDAGRSPGGEPGVHEQTLALYRLLDELRARHPGMEIESCSSGGARADLGILERTDRVWGSDTNDALERQAIQRWTQMLLPPELVGSHVGPPTSHTTGRTHTTSFRAATALFGHFGIEWDLTSATAEEMNDLARWVAVYKQMRWLLRSGRVVRGDHADPANLVHGVVAQDGSEAIYALVPVTTSVFAPGGRCRLPGLVPTARYRVRPLPPGDRPSGIDAVRQPLWIEAGGVTLPGSVLAHSGLEFPIFHPEQALLLHLTRE
jgi:alpha-galactosidase